jgi:hypothetical protein
MKLLHYVNDKHEQYFNLAIRFEFVYLTQVNILIVNFGLVS